ncbi:MAG: hypothetical protein V4760_19175, partial [Bdellovibrionota bacterium]
MKHVLVLVVLLLAFPLMAQKKSSVTVPVIPPSRVSREMAWEYLTLTKRNDVMEKAYRARFNDAKGAKPVSEALKKKHLDKINGLMIGMIQKSFSPSAMDSVLVFLRTPGGQRWAEDASEFNAEFADEITEAWNEFAEEIKEANEAAADSAAVSTGSSPSVAPPPAPTLPPKYAPT